MEEKSYDNEMGFENIVVTWELLPQIFIKSLLSADLIRGNNKSNRCQLGFNSTHSMT